MNYLGNKFISLYISHFHRTLSSSCYLHLHSFQSTKSYSYFILSTQIFHFITIKLNFIPQSYCPNKWKNKPSSLLISTCLVLSVSEIMLKSFLLEKNPQENFTL